MRSTTEGAPLFTGMIVHGDRDSYVSYEIVRAAAQAQSCDFHTVAGSEHGFDIRERGDEAITVTVAWIAGSYRTDRARRGSR